MVWLTVFAVSFALLGGAIHGTAMAARKYYARGQPNYWNEPRWYIGVLGDAVGGAFCWPAMPLLSVFVYIPLTILAQMGSSYLTGIYLFKENSTYVKTAGLLVAVFGVFALAVQGEAEKVTVSVTEFWPRLADSTFLAANGLNLLLIIAVHKRRDLAFMLAAAWMDATQFLCSRTLASFLEEDDRPWQPVAVDLSLIAAIKLITMVLVLHFQQQALEADLVIVGTLYPVAVNLGTCVLSAAYFGDQLALTPNTAACSAAILVGFALLSSDTATPDPPLLLESDCPSDSSKLCLSPLTDKRVNQVTASAV